MFRYLADTNVLGYLLRNANAGLVLRMRSSMATGEVAISVVTRAETRFGQALMDRRDKRRAVIDLLLLEMPVLEWTSNAADQYGALAAQLQAKGQPIGVLDTMIAAHALAAGLTVVTHNMRDFRRVPGLAVVDWMT